METREECGLRVQRLFPATQVGVIQRANSYCRATKRAAKSPMPLPVVDPRQHPGHFWIYGLQLPAANDLIALLNKKTPKNKSDPKSLQQTG